MSTVHRMHTSDLLTNPVEGKVRWKPQKSLWYLTIGLTALVFAPLTFSWSAAIVSFIITVTTLCLGHTLGFHRRLVHNSYDCPLWLERVFVYLGTLVGIGGPSRILYLHDIRDWSQRHPSCHAFFIHTGGFWRDLWEQQNCEITLSHPPRFIVESRVANDHFYRFLDATWMIQQLPPALILYAIGGWSWVIWGCFVRVFISLTGHWLVGYLAHKGGARTWHIENAAVQGYNVHGLEWLTMGENWHNNHHAYPESARLGLRSGELDLGWLVLKTLAHCGLVWNLHTPENLPARKERIELSPTLPMP